MILVFFTFLVHSMATYATSTLQEGRERILQQLHLMITIGIQCGRNSRNCPQPLRNRPQRLRRV